MIDTQRLHKAQLSILDALRHTDESRFSDLMQPTGLTSDAFKFHIRKLVHAGIVEKTESGLYRLTIRGKEVANTINRETRTSRKQPKLSVVLVVSRQGPAGQTEYLVQQRLRNPYYDYRGFISGPILWGEEPEETAARECLKQAGVAAEFAVRATYRQRDFDQDTGVLLEDKLLTVLSAEVDTASILEDWSGGHNIWMTAADLAAQPKHFASCLEMIQMLEQGVTYASRTAQTATKDY